MSESPPPPSSSAACGVGEQNAGERREARHPALYLQPGDRPQASPLHNPERNLKLPDPPHEAPSPISGVFFTHWDRR